MGKYTPNHKFEPNQKYYTVSIYTIVVVLICAVLIRLIFNWADTSTVLNKYLSAATPVIAGFFLAYLINPLEVCLERRLFKKLTQKHPTISRTLCILLTYIIVVGVLTLIIIFLIPQIAASVTELINRFQLWYQNFPQLMEKLQERIPELDLTAVTTALQDGMIRLVDLDRLTNMLSNMLPKIFSTSMTLFKAAYTVLFALIVSIYVLFDRDRLVRNVKRGIKACFRPERATVIEENLSTSHHIFSRFIVGKTFDSLIIGLLCFIIMSLFNMPFPLIISLIVGITNMIPYVGPFIGAVPGFLIMVISSPKMSVGYLILILCIQQLDGLYIGPKILGSSTGLRPIWIILAISLGGAAGGIIGMFLGVPFFAVVTLFTDNWVTKKIEERDRTAVTPSQPSNHSEKH